MPQRPTIPGNMQLKLWIKHKSEEMTQRENNGGWLWIFPLQYLKGLWNLICPKLNLRFSNTLESVLYPMSLYQQGVRYRASCINQKPKNHCWHLSLTYPMSTVNAKSTGSHISCVSSIFTFFFSILRNTWLWAMIIFYINSSRILTGLIASFPYLLPVNYWYTKPNLWAP